MSRKKEQYGVVDLLAEPPKGFKARSIPDSEAHQIVYRPSRLNKLALYVLGLLLFWTAGGAFAVYGALTARDVGTRVLLVVWFFPWLVGEIFLGRFASWKLVGRTFITMTADRLTVERRLFGFARSWSVQPNEIKEVFEDRSGISLGSSEWYGLRVLAGEDLTVLAHGPKEDSVWLGKVLRDWSKAPFLWAHEIHEAAREGNAAQVDELLRSLPELVNAVDSENFTPLHWAAVQGHKEIVAVLLAHGADVNARNADGLTPLELAIESKYAAVVEMLMPDGGGETQL